jgi:4-alpha-glucanotransferase
VGEDLGTVEPGVREALAEHDMLSYRLLWFEADDPAQWPVKALAAVTTHDLPTIAGLWSGRDVDEQALYTDEPRDRLERGREQLLGRLEAAGVYPGDRPSAAVQAPCTLLAATLDDAVAAPRRPNMPGVVERPNWSLSLPVPVEDLPRHPTATSVAAILHEAVGGLPPQV